MAEDQDLQLLRATRPPQQPHQREQVPHDEIHKRPEQAALPRPQHERPNLASPATPGSHGRVCEPYAATTHHSRAGVPVAVSTAISFIYAPFRLTKAGKTDLAAQKPEKTERVTSARPISHFDKTKMTLGTDCDRDLFLHGDSPLRLEPESPAHRWALSTMRTEHVRDLSRRHSRAPVTARAPRDYGVLKLELHERRLRPQCALVLLGLRQHVERRGLVGDRDTMLLRRRRYARWPLRRAVSRVTAVWLERRPTLPTLDL